MTQHLTRVDPTPDPVFTAEKYRDFFRIRDDSEDDLINDLIASATDLLETQYGLLGGLVLMPQTWQLDLSQFPVNGKVDLKLGPVISVTSIAVADTEVDGEFEDSDRSPVPTSTFHLWRDARRAWLKPREGQCWPEAVNAPASIRVRYQAGFSVVPPKIVQAIRMIVAHWYENREAAVTGSISEVQLGVQTCIRQAALPSA